jgi:hypothetical protein
VTDIELKATERKNDRQHKKKRQMEDFETDYQRKIRI